MKKKNTKIDTWEEKSNTFKFEAAGAPVSIMAAEWSGGSPSDASIFFHNDMFIENFGDHRGKLLTEFLNEISLKNDQSIFLPGPSLLEDILQNGNIHSIEGSLAGKRIELSAKLQIDTNHCIQSTVFDVTERLLDHVTGLPSRELFFDRINIDWYEAVRNKKDFSLLFLDLDEFKKANDIFGHQAGDAILSEVGKRLRSMFRRHETVARIGGDEFVICLTDMNAKQSEKLANEKIIPLLKAPYLYNKATIDFISVSIGIASFTEHSMDINTLVAMADAAMYKAKKAGKNKVVIY